MPSPTVCTEGFLDPPTTVGQVVGAMIQDNEPTIQHKSALIGECPNVFITMNGNAVPFVLDTGSQVTLLTKSMFKKYLQGTGLTSVDGASWLTLRAANGLKIPYVGYALVDCTVGSIQVQQKGVIIVDDECLGPDKGLLGMNIIKPVWSALTQGNHPGLSAFKTTIPLVEGKAWAQAFVECHQITTRGSLPLYQGIDKLPRQQPVVIPPESEMIVWTQVSDGAPNQSASVMIEPLPGSDQEWCVGRTLAMLSGGRVPCRLCNPNPYPVEVPQRQPLAQVTEVEPTEIQAEQDLFLSRVETDVVEVEVRQIGVLGVAEEAEPHPVMSLKGDLLAPDQQGQMTNLLHRWRKVFASHEEDFGCTGVVKHQIPTGSAPPSRERYRPIPPKLVRRAEDLVTEYAREQRGE